MKDPVFDKPLSDLRRRMQEDMAVRRFGEKTQHDYIRHVENFVKPGVMGFAVLITVAAWIHMRA